MDQENKSIEDWRSEVSNEAKDALKIADGEKVQFVFLTEGERRTHPDFGTSIIFGVSKDEKEMSFYVNANNFDLLRQIKELGALTGLKVEVSRTGSKKSDTRYTIKKSE